MKWKILGGTIFTLLSCLTVALACGTRNYWIQSPTDNAVYDLSIDSPTTMFAVCNTYGYTPNCGTENDNDYFFKLVNVTDSTETTCSNSGCPSPMQVGYDTIDQYSWSSPSITWQTGKTYRLELYASNYPTCRIDAVTFTTLP